MDRLADPPGRPDQHGGRPDQPGRPDQYGRPDQHGGRPDQPGRPDQYGRPDQHGGRPDQDSDRADLAGLGYRQRLNRSLGSFSSFAAGFSYISILTGMFQLFGFGYGFGGPLLFWSWLLVFGGQFCVALVFAEMGARYPVAGSVYQWSKQVTGRGAAWFAGWTMLIGSVVSIAAVSIAEQVVLPAVWSGFTVFTDPTRNAVFLGSCTIVLTTVINVLGVKVMSKINNVGVAAELVGVAVLLVLLAFHIHRGPQVVFSTQGAGPGLPGYAALGLLTPLLLAAIMPAYVMYGFDTAGSLAEETLDPRRRTPAAILRALAAAGGAGALLLLLALMTSGTLSLTKLGSGGLPMVIESALGATVGKIVLMDVAVAVFVCTLAIQTATIRVAFSMARDHGLPFGANLAHVTEHRHSPAAPALISGALAVGLLVLNVGNAQIFLIVTSVAIVIVYLAYLLVTGPVLLRRLGGWPPRPAAGLFTLGRRAGLVVNAVAVGYGAVMAVNLIWPRALIYGKGGYAWGGVVFVGAVLALGGVYYLSTQRGAPTRVAAEHRVGGPQEAAGSIGLLAHRRSSTP